jgi:hypothetical protein
MECSSDISRLAACFAKFRQFTQVLVALPCAHEAQTALAFMQLAVARADVALDAVILVLTTYGRSSGSCVDPIEKKPLNHFLPGTPVLSFGTAGCNLTCKFCQNWDISKARDLDRIQDVASPAAIAEAAVRSGCRSVAFTYNDPVIFLEYAVDVAQALSRPRNQDGGGECRLHLAGAASRVLSAHGCRQHRPQRLHRRVL